MPDFRVPTALVSVTSGASVNKILPDTQGGEVNCNDLPKRIATYQNILLNLNKQLSYSTLINEQETFKLSIKRTYSSINNLKDQYDSFCKK